ncbi:hypothetical protein [Novosphingopyxis sp.]|uniref:hypothetical protein n=1 Tax=Novosphingopyxis sp. TaxID=2709690 RepID=UPI003B5A03AD
MNDVAVRVTAGALAGERTSVRAMPADIQDRKAKIVVEKLRVGRDAVKCVDVSDREGWAVVINEVLDSGVEVSELEDNFSASENTVYKWRQGRTAPRLLTRKLLQSAIVEMIDDKIAESSTSS